MKHIKYTGGEITLKWSIFPAETAEELGVRMFNIKKKLDQRVSKKAGR